VPIRDRRRSRRFSVVEIQKPTQPLATNDSSRPRTNPGQLTIAEVATVKTMVLTPEHRHMPLRTLVPPMEADGPSLPRRRFRPRHIDDPGRVPWLRDRDRNAKARALSGNASPIRQDDSWARDR
jgi:hypothetical protein